MKKFYWIKSILALTLCLIFATSQVFAEKGWQRVTSETTLAPGDTIIIAAANFNFAISTTQNNNNRGKAAITKSGEYATLVGAVQQFVLQAGELAGTFHIFDFDNNGGYLYAPATGNHLKTSTTIPANNAGDWIINISEADVITITSQNTNGGQIYMRYNDASNLFSCYGSSSSVVEPVTIYKYVELQDVIVEAPICTPNSGSYYEEISVSLSCLTTGATILYTTDGSNPKTNGSVYTAPFSVSSTSIVKSVAFVGTDTSNITTRAYTIISPVEVANIAAFKAASTSTSTTVYKITGDVNFVFGNSTYKYVEDATAGLLIYNIPAAISTNYNEGDVISGGIIGTFAIYKNQIELVPLVNTAEATSNIGEITPTVVSISDLKTNYSQYDASLITLENITFPYGFTGAQQTIVYQNGDSLTLYNRFGLDTTLAPGTTANLTSLVAIYESDIRLYPRTNADIQTYVPIPQPTLSIISPVDGSTYSTLDTITVDVNIENFTLSVDGLIKAESELLSVAGLTSPFYFDALTWMIFTNTALTPLPAGNHSVTLTLVDMDSVALDPAVSQTVSISVIAPTAEAPVFSPLAGTFADSVVVSLSCATANAEIRYTVDGSEPTATSTLYAAPFTLTNNATIKAKAFMNNVSWNDSPVAEAIYTIAHEPMMNVTPEALSFSSTVTTGVINISSAFLANNIVLVSTDGHFTLSDTIITANDNTTVTVTFDATEPAQGSIVISTQLTDSILIREVQLTATALLAAPVISPADGTTDTLITVSMSCTVPEATIYYTFDGTEPTEESDIYDTPIELTFPGTYTFKAMAVAENWENSPVTTATYTVSEPVIPSIDTVMYSIGFEVSEGFTASTVYNNPTVTYTGNAGQQWGTIFGTPSTTSPVCGDQSMQMRWYSTTPATIGYTFTNFDIRNVTYVTFAAKNTNELNVVVSYSTDGGNTFIGDSIIELTSNKATYRYNVSETGEYDFVRLRFAISLPASAPSSTSRIYIDSVVVYGVPGVISTTVQAPVIAPNGGLFYDALDVTMSCPTEGATIRYTLDGSEPTETSSEYTAPINITSTTTVMAKAWKEGMTASNVATQVYNFPTEVENIAAFKAIGSPSVCKITGDVAFVFRSGSYMFVTDETAALLIYDNQNIISTEYQEGDIISNGISGLYSLYQGMIEMTPTHNTEAASGNIGTIEAIPLSIVEVISSYNIYESALVSIDTVTFISSTQFVKDNDTLEIRDRFSTLEQEITEGMIANVTGFVAKQGNTIQLYPRNDDDIVEVEPVSINHILSQNVSIYPNPSADKINIDLTGIQAQSVEIFSMNGQQLYSTIPTTSMLTISLNNFASGVYFVRIVSEEGVILQKISKIE